MVLTTDRYVDLVKLLMQVKGMTIEEAGSVIEEAAKDNRRSVMVIEDAILTATGLK